MTIVFIVVCLALIAAAMFIIGFEVSDIKHFKDTEELVTKISNDDEKESWGMRFKTLHELSKNNIRMGIFIVAMMSALLAFNIWSYRDQGMDGLKRGKYGYEEIVRTKTKGGEVKVDTTYNFYRIKPEKK